MLSFFEHFALFDALIVAAICTLLILSYFRAFPFHAGSYPHELK